VRGEVEIAIRFLTLERYVMAGKVPDQALGIQSLGAYQEHIMTAFSQVIDALADVMP
jgi:hypothetical protein